MSFAPSWGVRSALRTKDLTCSLNILLGDAHGDPRQRFEISKRTRVQFLWNAGFDAGLFETIFQEAGLRHIIEGLEDDQ